MLHFNSYRILCHFNILAKLHQYGGIVVGSPNIVKTYIYSILQEAYCSAEKKNFSPLLKNIVLYVYM